MNGREVSKLSIIDAIDNPMHVVDKGYNSKGERSVKHIGESATEIINPDTNRIVTCWKTGDRERRRYGSKDQ